MRSSGRSHCRLDIDLSLPVYQGAPTSARKRTCIVRSSQTCFEQSRTDLNLAVAGLTVALVDLDSPGAAAAGRTPALGPALTASPAAIDSAQEYHLGFNVIDNTPFDISAATGSSPRGLDVHEWAAQAIQDEDYFGVIIGTCP